MEPGLLVARGGGEYAERARALGVPVADLELRSGADPRVLTRGPAAMRGWDVHHFHSAEPGLMAGSLRVRGAVRVYTNRGGAVEQPGSPSKRLRHGAVRRMLRRGFHGFSGNTAHAARVAAERYGLPPARVAVTPNGIDFSLLEPERPRDEVRARLGAGPDDVLVGTSAVLKTWKRVERLLQAVATAEDPRLRAVVIGDGPERAALEASTGEMGLAGRVTFTGMLRRVADEVAALDAFVLTSGRQESFGNSVVEAMALAVPSVVFADSPGALEHVEDGRTGLVVPDVAGLASALVRLADDPAAARRLGDAGAARVRDRYSLEAMVAAYRTLYEVAGGRAGRNRV